MSVSIIIPVFNHARFIRECVESLLAEGISDLEIIVVDDASTDGSLESIADLPTKNIRLGANRGPAFARNAGLEVASGDLIDFFDSDDILEKDGLKFRVNWLNEHPEWEAVQGSVFSYIDAQGDVRRFDPDLKELHRRLPSVITWEDWKAGLSVPIPLQPCLFRKRVLDEIGPFDDSWRYAEDLDLFYRFLRRHSLPHLFQPVMRYRVHGTNISTQQAEGKLLGRARPEAQRFLLDRFHGLR